ncbi:MAG: magnesium transporter [Gemmatimonadetes bacterium]|nr:magnesium transporter [Gemmatimonadota bacterium]MDA1103803.1 magnesium transporter [Gemmatimonadota bacterium]
MDTASTSNSATLAVAPPTPEQIADDLSRLDSVEAGRTLGTLDDELVIEVLRRMNPAMVADIIPEMGDEQRRRLVATGPQAVTRQWALNMAYPEDSIGRLMEPPTAVFRPDQTVAEVTARVRLLVTKIFITYCFVTDEEGRLIGIVTMRDLLVSDPEAVIGDVMLKDPFSLSADAELKDAMKLVVRRHFPVYPVCEDGGLLVGLVRGQAMFEEHTFEVTAQPGQMVGVDKEERLTTPVRRSLKLRHPWLQLNLLTAFVAAAVVAVFQDTLDQMVILALFLPVLAGQSGNTGCQALAVTLRGLTLGEVKDGDEKALVAKEAQLGLANGALVGVTAGLGMYLVATAQGQPAALTLAAIVFVAMIGSCVISGLAGAFIPLTLRRVGADPATASSIFLTTATDVASMGLFLGLATMALT